MLSITRIAVLVAALLGAVALASKPADHRTCEQTNFCARNRNRAPVGTVATNAEHTHKDLRFDLTNPNAPAGMEPAPLRARVSLIGDHTLQFTVEEDTLVTDAKGVRYEAAYVIRSEYAPEPEYLEVRETPEGMVACAKTDKPTTNCVSLELNPFKITHLYNDRVASVINGESLFNFEQHRDRLPTDSDAMWAETWNGWTDVKPRGPASLSLDVTFPSADILYGLPSDSRKLALDVTRGPSVPTRDPYRLYNLPPTSTAYSTNSSGADSCGSDSRVSAETAPRPSSGSVPYVVGYGSGGSDVSIATGMLFMNPSEMFVDVYAGEGDKGRTTHWIAETGSMHVYLYVHDEPKLIQQLLSQTVGLPAMPPIFALGYHQSYNSYTHQEPLLDTLEVIRRNEFPCESFWLDHGSNEESRSFTWHPSGFYDPALFQLDVSRRGMHVVTAVSPHIAAIPGFAFYDAIADKTAFVDGPEDAPFEGKTIAGVSSWPNFARHIAREQWSRFFAPRLYKETSMYLHAWSDRNEPEVLDGPEQTMPKGVMHGKGRGEYLLEHREIHNMHGLFSAESSFVGIYLRQLANVGLPKKFVHPFAPEGHYPITPVAGYAVESQRPFLLTRSFFAGSHRFGAIALGGASASWETYRSSIGSLLSLSVAGMPFVGADVGGYTGSLSNELAERWFQMAAFTPFMRVHRDGSKGGSALEPWSYANATGTRIRAALRRRYDHMAYLYTLARVANTTGLPLMRPLVYEFPADAATLSLDSQFMLGEAIMVAPVSQAGHTSVNVYIPNDTAGKRSVWYDLRTLKRVPAPDAKGFSPVKAPADYTPVLYRAGHIIPKQPTQKFQKIPHLTTAYQSTAPYEFVVALTNDLRAQGNLYLDDGSSYDFFMRNYFYMQYTIAPESGEDDKKAAIPARLVIDGSRITLPSILPLEDPNPLVAAGTLLESFVILGIPENIRATKAYITRKGEQYPFDGFIEMDLATVTVRIPSGSTFIVGTEFTMTIELEERPVYGPVDSHSIDSSSTGSEDTTFAAAIKAVDGLSSAPVAVSSDAAAAAVATAVASLERTGLRRRLGLSMN